MRLSALALAAALLAPVRPAVAEEPARPINLEALRGKLEISSPHELGPGGLRIHVDGNTTVQLPLVAEVLELDVEASGPVMLTWASHTPGRQVRAFGPPWRHLTLPRARSLVPLDLRITEGWNPQARPALALTGIGEVIIHAMRVVPVPRNPGEIVADYDRAQRWAPESPAHTTINFVTPSFWRASRGVWLSDVVALVAAVAFALALGITWLRQRRLGVPRALAVACLVAAGLWDAHLLLRFLPAFRLRPTFDVEARIRDGYDVAPDVGELSALARATLKPGERVGVIGSQGNWFAPQTICFNLAPRPCVILTAGVPAREHAGISGVGKLRDDELDAVITYRAGPPPAGFTPVAALGTSAVIARRRP
jgi:hypothetical protein